VKCQVVVELQMDWYR